MRCKTRHPTFVVVVETALVVVDEDGRGDMHRVAKQKSFPDAAFPQTTLDLGRDVDECPSSGNVEPKLLPEALQIPPPHGRSSRGFRKNLDLLGILILGFATAMDGGILRDALLHRTPVSFTEPVRPVLPPGMHCGGRVVLRREGEDVPG
jgi:hypothetical protein